jgi:hypothetical protein
MEDEIVLLRQYLLYGIAIVNLDDASSYFLRIGPWVPRLRKH